MTKLTETVVIRMSPEQKAELQQQANAAGVSLGVLLRTMAAVESSGRRNTAGSVPFKSEAIPAYRCPDNRCDRTFGSPQAKCPVHGRTVVPK